MIKMCSHRRRANDTRDKHILRIFTLKPQAQRHIHNCYSHRGRSIQEMGQLFERIQVLNPPSAFSRPGAFFLVYI